MSSNYTGNPASAEAPSPAPSTNGLPIVVLPAAGDPLTAASVAQAFKTLADFNAWLTNNAYMRVRWFGDGSDGAVVMDGTNTFSFASKVGNVYTLTRPVFASSFSISAAPACTLKTAGFPIYCTGAFSHPAGSTISDNGIDGGTGPHSASSPGSGATGVGAAAAGFVVGLGGNAGSGGPGTPNGAGAGQGVSVAWGYHVPPYTSQNAPQNALFLGTVPIRGGGSGGGGGGGGGAVLIICNSQSGAASAVTVTAGTGGLLHGTGTNGVNGVAGNATPFVVTIA